MQGEEYEKPEPRITVYEPATVINEDGEETVCTIVDVSKTGFRLQLEKTALKGKRFHLVSADGSNKAIAIKWASAGEVGGQFID